MQVMDLSFYTSEMTYKHPVQNFLCRLLVTVEFLFEIAWVIFERIRYHSRRLSRIPWVRCSSLGCLSPDQDPCAFWREKHIEQGSGARQEWGVGMCALNPSTHRLKQENPGPARPRKNGDQKYISRSSQLQGLVRSFSFLKWLSLNSHSLGRQAETDFQGSGSSEGFSRPLIKPALFLPLNHVTVGTLAQILGRNRVKLLQPGS